MISITKAKLVKRETLEIEFSKKEDPGKYSAAYETPVHDDMRAAFDRLRVHFAMLAGYMKPAAIENIETPPEDLITDYHVSGYTRGHGDDPWIIITGYKKLTSGKAVNLNTPRQPFEENEKVAYAFIDDLVECMERIEKEVRLYVDGKKRGPDKQGKLDFGAGEQKEPVTKLVIAAPPTIEERAAAMAKEKLDRENVRIGKDVDSIPVGTPVPGHVRPGHIPQADPAAMERVKNDGAVNGVADVAAAIVAETNGHQQPEGTIKRAGRPRKQQTPDNPSGLG